MDSVRPRWKQAAVLLLLFTFGLLRHRFWVNKKCRCFFMRKGFSTPRYLWGFDFFFRQLLEVRYVETESYGGCCRCSRWWPHPSSCVLIVLRHPAKDRTGSQTSPFGVKLVWYWWRIKSCRKRCRETLLIETRHLNVACSLLWHACSMILLMEELLHHLKSIRYCKWWDKLHIHQCRISSINRIICVNLWVTSFTPGSRSGHSSTSVPTPSEGHASHASSRGAIPSRGETDLLELVIDAMVEVPLYWATKDTSLFSIQQHWRFNKTFRVLLVGSFFCFVLGDTTRDVDQCCDKIENQKEDWNKYIIRHLCLFCFCFWTKRAWHPSIFFEFDTQDGVQIFPDPNRIAEVQQLMTDTWLPHFSRDRRLIHGSAAVPVGCRVANVLRVENHRAYARYSSYKDGLKMKRPGPCTPFPVRTSNRINLLEDDACSKISQITPCPQRFRNFQDVEGCNGMERE